MVGRNEYRKGFHVLQETLSILDEPIDLHLVGDWPQIKSTHHNVKYHGVVRDKHELITIVDSCDVLLLPSLSEGMPTVVLEAKARGLRIIATDVGAMSKLEDNLIEPENATDVLDAMASAIRGEGHEGHLPDEYRWRRIARDTAIQLA